MIKSICTLLSEVSWSYENWPDSSSRWLNECDLNKTSTINFKTGLENNSTQNNRAYKIYVPSLNLRVDSNLISSVQVHVAKPVVTKCIKIEIKDRN